MNSWANNIREIQHFLKKPWTRFGPPWSGFGPLTPEVVHMDQLWNCPYCLLATFVHVKNISAVTEPILTKPFGLNFSDPIFLDQGFFWPKIFVDLNFFEPHFWHQFLCINIFFKSKLFLNKIFGDQKFLGPKILFGPKNFCCESDMNKT